MLTLKEFNDLFYDDKHLVLKQTQRKSYAS